MKRIFATVVAVGATFAFTHAANAQEYVPLALDKAEYLPGAPIKISADGGEGCAGQVTSKGFAAPVGLEIDPPNLQKGLGTAAEQAGDYEATATCAGKPVTVKFRVVETFYFFPDDVPVVEAGGTIDVHRQVTALCDNPVTSKGFVEPINIIYKTEGSLRSGSGKVIDTPGTYEASMKCSGQTMTRKFTIKAKAGQPKQQEKKPVVKPKGAPQTGGGGTAR
ncbi:hypothetical protein [Lentzea aerocolonigenes]|uniref:hypothetical protein n=1 Tax=Lentzea aerocolonigenes TaxID=68170 RepID=UPI000698615C|nr:hypothetical protein [Lentzea aerocolonigenes]